MPSAEILITDGETCVMHLPSLVDSDWSGTVKDEKKWLLTQAAYSEMLARAAYYRKSNNQQHQ